jgi:diguanylate cyclase (GGDEF)-like protein
MTIDVSTVYSATLASFAAVALVWLFVIRAHPNLAAGRIWMAASLVAAFGVSAVALRSKDHQLLAIVVGGGPLVAASCLGWIGTRRFLGLPAPWRASAAITLLTIAGMIFFTVWWDDMPARLSTYSIGQLVPLSLAAADLLRRGRRTPGMVLAALGMIVMALTDAARVALALADVGGDMTYLGFNNVQAAILLANLFTALIWNFGFLLMTVEKLRSEILDLAARDDLTGVANRRRFVEVLRRECSRSCRSLRPFVLMAVDLDGFKAINDHHGHQAGDACLKSFTAAALGRLRGTDLLARTGGDEFCIILPETELEQAEHIARSLIEAARSVAISWNGTPLKITASLGFVEWSMRVGADSSALLVVADEALYVAKRAGRDRFAAAPRDEPFRLLKPASATQAAFVPSTPATR